MRWCSSAKPPKASSDFQADFFFSWGASRLSPASCLSLPLKERRCNGSPWDKAPDDSRRRMFAPGRLCLSEPEPGLWMTSLLLLTWAPVTPAAGDRSRLPLCPPPQDAGIKTWPPARKWIKAAGRLKAGLIFFRLPALYGKLIEQNNAYSWLVYVFWLRFPACPSADSLCARPALTGIRKKSTSWFLASRAQFTHELYTAKANKYCEGQYS